MNTQTVVEQSTAPVTYAAAGGTIVAGLALGDWAAIIGIAVTLATFGINWWYRHMTYRKTNGNN